MSLLFRCAIFMLNELDNSNNKLDYSKNRIPADLVELLDLFKSFNFNRIDGIKYSIQHHSIYLLNYYCKGVNDWNEALDEVAKLGDLDMVKYFQKQANNEKKFSCLNWNRALSSAALSGNLAMVKYFKKQGATIWYGALCEAARSGNLEIIKYFKKQADKKEKFPCLDWNNSLYSAALSGNLEMVKYFKQQGATAWNWALYGAAWSGKLEIVKYFKKQGATTWNYVLSNAVLSSKSEIVKYCQEQFAISSSQ